MKKWLVENPRKEKKENISKTHFEIPNARFFKYI